MTLRDCLITGMIETGAGRLDAIFEASHIDSMLGFDCNQEVPADAEQLVQKLVNAMVGMASELYTLAEGEPEVESDEEPEEGEEPWRN